MKHIRLLVSPESLLLMLRKNLGLEIAVIVLGFEISLREDIQEEVLVRVGNKIYHLRPGKAKYKT